MKKLISTLIVGVFAASAFAVTPTATPAATSTATAEAKPAVEHGKTPVHAKKDKATHAAKKHQETTPAAAKAAPAVK